MRTIIPNAAGPGRVQRFVDDLDGMALLERYLFTPTFNIDGLYGGYIGPGSPTFSLPDRVVCNMDIRLVRTRSRTRSPRNCADTSISTATRILSAG